MRGSVGSTRWRRVACVPLNVALPAPFPLLTPFASGALPHDGSKRPAVARHLQASTGRVRWLKADTRTLPGSEDVLSNSGLIVADPIFDFLGRQNALADKEA